MFWKGEMLLAQLPVYQWAKALSGNVESIQRSTVVDAAGNVYLYGVFFGTVDFDPGTGTVNVTPSPYGCNVYIAKYDANGNYLWVKNIPINASYGANSMTKDAGGNLLITGFYSGTNVDFDPNAGTAYLSSVSGSSDIYIAKYDADGNYIWAKSIGSTGADVSNEIVTDESGNIFITGYYNSTVDFDPDAGTANLTSAGSSDIFMAKYNSVGSLLWAKSIGGTSTDDSRDLALDGSGNIFITGSYYGTADFDPGVGTVNLTSAGYNDIFFAKYDGSGNYLWAHSLGSTSYDIGSGLDVDASGNVFITGTFNNTVDFDPGPGTVNYTAALGNSSYFGKYDASGNYVWAKSLPLNTANMDILLDPCGTLFLSGSYLSGGATTIDLDPGSGSANVSVPGGLPPPNYNIFARYDLNGTYLWGNVFGRTCYCSVMGYKAALATDGSTYVYYSGIFNAGWFGTYTVDFDPGSAVANLTATSAVDNTFFAKYNCTSVTLPVELFSFYGESSGGINHLHWSTASELNNRYFEVERSSDGENFESIGTVNGMGNSTHLVNYAFDDRDWIGHMNYYRLRQVDFDGSFRFSDVIIIRNEFADASISVSTISHGVFQVECSAAEIESAIVYDLNGREVMHFQSNPGTNRFVIDLHESVDGIYFLTMVTREGIYSLKLAVSR
jgi:hypothetical protein